MVIIPTHSFIHSFIRSFIQAISIATLQVRYYSARILVPEFHAEAPQTIAIKNLPKVPTWRLEEDSDPRPSGRKASTLPMHHYVQRHTTSEVSCQILAVVYAVGLKINCYKVELLPVE